MTPKHTPGPWEFKPQCTTRNENGTVTAVVGPEFGYNFVKVTAMGTGAKEEVEATARLIAATPDMLAALKKAEKNIEQLCQLVCVLSGYPKKARAEDFAEEVREAIAKAGQA